MPVGIQRLNQRHQHPTPHIIFIKPLPGADSLIAQEFLERVAAICHPIMKAHHLSVMTLEEYEPNKEFIGRNFNAGEVIQLVLRSRSGAWLGFRSVVMVMMHELAHCMQMNHSRAFWKVRNEYAEDMRQLWARNYTGEGVWGPGRSMGSGQFENRPVHKGELPADLCGGTYRSRRRKRKRGGKEGGGQRLTYAERQQRRIAKKFGVDGKQLGEDEIVRIALEKGKRAVKPKVANSKRGRELRAQAALARFGIAAQEEIKKAPEQGSLPSKKEDPDVKPEDATDSGSETESDYEEAAENGTAATDINGHELHDSAGRGLIKVCPDEDSDDVEVKSELQELQDLDRIPSENGVRSSITENTTSKLSHIPMYNPTTEVPAREKPSKTTTKQRAQDAVISAHKGAESAEPEEPTTLSKMPSSDTQNPAQQLWYLGTCKMCSLENGMDAVTCMACANVLRPDKDMGHWMCKNKQCADVSYINAGDVAICGICGQRRG
jgi:hypothetical protein